MKGKTVSVALSKEQYEALKEAIEKRLMTSVRDLSRIITKARTRDEEQTDKYNVMVKNLLENGYCESCVDVVDRKSTRLNSSHT